MFLHKNHTVYIYNEKETKNLAKISRNMSFGAVRIDPEGIVVPQKYLQIADDLYNFKYRSTDIIVQAYPKSGTTWLQEILWQMTNNINEDNDIKDLDMFLRSPYQEFDIVDTVGYTDQDSEISEIVNHICQPLNKDQNRWIDLAEAIPDTRVFKSHFPPTLLNPNLLDIAKVVLILRDPKDVCLSYYYHHRQMYGFEFKGSVDEFADKFLQGQVFMGGYVAHARQWLRYKNHKNVHVMFYEDLKTNTMAELRKLNRFIGTRLSDDQLKEIQRRTTIDELKKLKTVLNADNDKRSNIFVEGETKESGGFFRKGIVGDSKKHFSPAIHRKFEEHFKEILKELDLPYIY